MASALIDFKTTLKATWEALTPITDGSDQAYAFIDDFVEERGGGQHREIWWGMPQQADPEDVGVQGHLRWSVNATLFLHRNDRTKDAFNDAVANEIVALLQAFYSAVWTPRVLGVVHGTVTNDEAQDEAQARSGGARGSLVQRVVFPFSVLCAEA